jgi:hypothetical protein
MTPVEKHLLELEDLEAIVVACSACRASISFPLDANRINLPVLCPNCSEEWSQDYPSNTVPLRERVKNFFDAYRRLQMELDGKSAIPARVKIRLQTASFVSRVPAASAERED